MAGLWDWFIHLNDGNKIAFGSLFLAALGMASTGIYFLFKLLFKKKTHDPIKSTPEEVAIALANSVNDNRDRLLEATQTLQAKDEEIRALKDAVEGLRELEKHDETAELAEEAERELIAGNPDKAKEMFRKIAEKKFERSQSEKAEAAQAYRRLGALAYLNDTQEALEAYQKSIELDPANADGWNNLGLLLKRLGQLNEASRAYKEVLKIGESTNDKGLCAVAYCNLGSIRRIQGDLVGAEEFHRKALKINEELGCKEGMASDYCNLGILRKTQGDLVGAEEFYRKSLKIDEELGRKEGMANQYGNLGILRYTQGDLVGAEEFYRKSLKIFEELGCKEGMAIQYCNLGILRQTQGDLVGAEELWSKSLNLFKEIGAVPMIERVQGLLDGLPTQKDN